MNQFFKKLRQFWAKTQPYREKTANILGKIGRVLCRIGKSIYGMRSVLLAIPVGAAAVMLALRNAVQLPEQVGIDLQASGAYALVVDRNLAVLGPLAITALCLLMMFSSRRVFYPWLISLFSLVLPLLLWVTNLLPG